VRRAAAGKFSRQAGDHRLHAFATFPAVIREGADVSRLGGYASHRGEREVSPKGGEGGVGGPAALPSAELVTGIFKSTRRA